MKPSIKTLLKVVDELNKSFSTCKFIIVDGLSDKDVRVVDISSPADSSILSSVVLDKLYRFKPDFEVTLLPDGVAQFYGVSDVRYLTLNFAVK